MEAFINWGVAKYFRRAMSFSPAADIGVKHVSRPAPYNILLPETVKLWENVELLAERGWSGVGGMVGGPLLQTSTAEPEHKATITWIMLAPVHCSDNNTFEISYIWSCQCQQPLDFYKCILYIGSTIIVQCIAREIGLSSPLLEG